MIFLNMKRRNIGGIYLRFSALWLDSDRISVCGQYSIRVDNTVMIELEKG